MAALDLQLKVDLKKQIRFPLEISPSPPSLLYILRQDTVILSALIKKLSVPKAYERKHSKYEDLVEQCCHERICRSVPQKILLSAGNDEVNWNKPIRGTTEAVDNAFWLAVHQKEQHMESVLVGNEPAINQLWLGQLGKGGVV